VWLGWWTEDKDPLGNLGKWLGVYVVLGIGSIAAVGCGIYQILVRIIDKSGVIFHDQLLETVSKAPLSFHASVDSGITVNRFSQDLRLIDMELPSAAFGMATTLSFSVAQFILVAVASKYMAAFLPVLMVILYLIQFFYLRTSRQVRLLDIEHKAPLYSQLIETLSGLPTIRAFQWEDRYEKKNLGLIDESQQPSYQIACLQCWLNLSTDLFIMLLAVVFITLATTLREEIGPRNIGMGLSNVLGFSGTMKSVVTFWVMLEISLGAVSRVRSFVQETKLEGADDPPTAEPKDAENWPTHGHIELRDVVASYPGTGPIINGVSLTVQPGEKIAICGRTGSGKSSLTLALLRMMDLDSGSIIVDGINTKTLPHEYVRKKFVALPQEAYVFDGTVRLNVDPSQTVGDAEIEEALVAVQLWPKVKSRGGLDTVISDDFFSPGEAQLLVFARAMLRNSRILILDEFTSA
jgi:ABC-type multidrug transport system fused ATPase/permease subunit